MLETVRFTEGVAALLATPEQVLVEVGAGQALSSFVKGNPECGRARFNQVLATLPSAQERGQDLRRLLETVGALWLLDVSVDGAQLYAQEQRRRVPLPTYPFERQRFWIDPQPQRNGAATATAPRRSDVTEWFATTSWKRSSLADALGAPALLAERRTWVLLVDECGIGTELAGWMSAHNQEVVTVAIGSAFAQHGTHAFTVRPTVRADYEVLLRALQARNLAPDQVVHLWNTTALTAGIDPALTLTPLLEHGFYSILALTQALGDQGLEACTISIISTELQDVTGAEEICPAKATLLGPCRIIPQEYTALTCRSIDIVLPGNGRSSAALIEQLALELTSGLTDEVVALRGSHRWIELFESVQIPATVEMPQLRDNGVYLITGGLGGIGLALAEELATIARAKLVLVGRSALPPREQWPHILATHDCTSGIGRRVQIISDLEARGTQVLVLQADVADPMQVRAAIEQAVSHFGAIHGVFHTAGVPGIGLIQLKTPEAAAGVLAPKVHGTLALVQALRDIPLDIFVLFSSVTSATGGGLGQVDYCAANAFLDAYARRHAHDHGRTIAISWGEWLWDAWQEGLLGFPEEARAFLIANRRAFGISFPEGMDALRRLLTSRLAHAFVTTQDLSWMVERSKQSSAAAAFKKLQASKEARQRYPRPALGTALILPRNPLEERIASVWGATLAMDQIGIDDNFFELGGNSLLGLDLIARVRKELKLDNLPAYVLYEAPTISAMAEYINQIKRETTPVDEDLESRSQKRRARLSHLQRRASTEELA